MKCFECNEKINENSDYHYGLNGKPFCEGCYNSEMENPSTLSKFSTDGVQVWHFSENFAFSEDGESLEKLPSPIIKQKWVSTDAWRGYTDWEIEKGFVEIADGWVTGYPDETVKRKLELADMFEDLKEGKIVPPCDIYWVFGVTSNIFSTASLIYIKKEDQKKIKKWLDKINDGIEGLKNSFS